MSAGRRSDRGAPIVASHRPAPPWQVEHWLNLPAGAAAPSVDSLKGKVIVLHAFQMLCPGCVAHGLPQARRVFEAFDPAQVAVVGLHSVFEHHAAMTPTALRAFVHEYRWPFAIGVDRRLPGDTLPLTMQAYGLRGTPSLVLVDANGQRRHHWFGAVDDLSLGAAIATLVAAAALPALSVASPPVGGAPVTAPCRGDACVADRA